MCIIHLFGKTTITILIKSFKITLYIKVDFKMLNSKSRFFKLCNLFVQIYVKRVMACKVVFQWVYYTFIMAISCIYLALVL